MAGYGNPGNPHTMDSGGMEGMDDLYGETDTTENKDKESVDEQNAMAAKTVVPIKVLQKDDKDKVEVGDERVVKVTGIHGDEATIIYAPAKDQEGEHEEGMHEESGPEELDRMDHEETESTKKGY